MKIKLVAGYHLTAGERRAIRAILDGGLTAGRVGRTDYRLTAAGPDVFRVSISRNERNDYGRMMPKVDTATIRVE